MQTRPFETPRPKPPAKMRRSLVKGSTTPPPAYASTFPFPTGGDDMDSAVNEGDGVGVNPDDDLAWLNEKSRDELTDLLVKADSLIKERETELSLTSAACRSLYENNAVLKTKHEALLARIPLSPNLNVKTISSPTLSPLISRSPLKPAFPLARSTSEAGARTSSPEHMLSKSYNYHSHHGRRVSAPTVDISFLADQNAELLSKLEKLESDASSADMVGRRELKRLEKEIATLKEEMEKAQVKSDELEEKAKAGFGLGAEKAIEEAWKRKKEREAKIKAMRKPARDTGEASTVKNFAPDTPSSVLRSGLARQYPGPELSTLEELSNFGEDQTDIDDVQPPIQQDQQLISKLLEKIQELESTNTKILQHQTETASRLQAVQRETEFMTRVYERLNEADEQQHDFDEAEARDQVPSGLVSRFAKSHRSLQSQLLAAKVKRQRSFNKRDPRSRGSVVGLFDDPPPNSSTPNKSNLPVPFNETSWNPPRHHSSYSIGSGGLVSPALSSLSLCSPPARSKEELSPDDVPVGPSLASELGDGWGVSSGSNSVYSRTRSLSDASLLSVPPSPFSLSRTSSHTVISQEESRDDNTETLPTPQSVISNSLQLSIEPPTPQRGTPSTQHHDSLIGNMSPRFHTARSLRARNYLCIDGRYPEPLGPGPRIAGLVRRRRFADDEASPTPTRLPRPGGQLFTEAFQVMLDEFDERGVGVQRGSSDVDISRSPSPDVEDYADAKEEIDEADREHAVANMDIGDEDGESFNEENSTLSIRSQENEVSRSKFGTVMVGLWMWLQFVIIMLVFVWAMARRGPKSVLKDAERKRTLSMKKRA